MQLAQLALHDFRNIESTELAPHRYFNIFVGANAQGKTNLLESVYLLGSLKSFRSVRNEELIRHGCRRAGIRGVSEHRGVRHRIQLEIDRDGKLAKLDDKIVKQPETYLNCLRPVVFAPEEVGLIKGHPAGRRRLLDRAVFQTETGYLADVQKYERQLKQRNRLIREGKSRSEIVPWTEELARSGARIRMARTRYLKRMAPRLTECYRQICGEKERVELIYREGNEDIAAHEQAILAELERQRDQETRYGMTLSGPHRDDYDFLIDDRPLKNYGSQGQQRSFILAFKAAQTLDLQQVCGDPPLLLLDDLTGELDRQRLGLFYRFLLSMKAQVFITATDVQPLREGGINDGKFFRVEEGVFHDDSL